jgi:ribosomal protein S18 acetylase RimI-like enzyme
MIEQVTKQNDFVKLAKLLNEAFATVAKEFGLTKENSPTNNAFIASDELKTQLIESREFYTYADNGKVVGFIAIEKALGTPDADKFYIEKLAVAPNSRHLGIGRQLMDFASNRIVELGGKCISIGLINSNTVLKDWYNKQGYVECSVKTFEHLPFEVCIMEKIITKQSF